MQIGEEKQRQRFSPDSRYSGLLLRALFITIYVRERDTALASRKGLRHTRAPVVAIIRIFDTRTR